MGFFSRFKKNKSNWPEEKKPQVKVDRVKDSVESHAAEKKKEEIKKSAPAVKKNLSRSNAHRVLLHPLVSEKAAHAEANNVYTFVVSRSASKDAIKQSVKDVYGIMPVKVRVINTEGKIARHGRSIGRRNDWKKAMVTLPAGKTISVHEGV